MTKEDLTIKSLCDRIGISKLPSQKDYTFYHSLRYIKFRHALVKMVFFLNDKTKGAIKGDLIGTLLHYKKQQWRVTSVSVDPYDLTCKLSLKQVIKKSAMTRSVVQVYLEIDFMKKQ